MTRKFLVFTLILLVLTPAAFAKRDAYYINAGVFNPKATDSGLMIHLNTSRVFDEKVDFGVSLDFYSKTSTDDQRITWQDPNTNTSIDTVVTSFESRKVMLPVMAELSIRIPVEFPVYPLIKAGLGYAFLWNSFDNYKTKESETQFYHGMCWRLGIGGMYRLGHSSALTVEGFYNGCKTSRKEDSVIGLPTRTEIDMSGLGFMVGLRLGGFY